EPHLEPYARRRLAHREQVVADREALRLHLGQRLQALGHREVDVAPARRSDVTRDTAAAPAEVVGGDDVAQQVEAELVLREGARVADPLALDRDRRLAEGLLQRDEAGRGPPVVHVATSRRAYAG